jgi:hypothetical protein
MVLNISVLRVAKQNLIFIRSESFDKKMGARRHPTYQPIHNKQLVQPQINLFSFSTLIVVDIMNHLGVG